MRCLIVLLALVAFVAGQTKQRAADQPLLNKQQDVIQLLQKISQPIPNQQLHQLGVTYDIEGNAHQYQNPIIVKYYAAAVKSGLVQPKRTAYSSSISQLRKEVSILYRILLGAKDYQTFLKTAAWARVHVNELQFVKALAAAVLTRKDTQGVILPPPYEVLPQYHLDSRIIQEAQDIVIQQIQKGSIQHVQIPANYSAVVSNEEQQLAYFTQDVGLAAYYTYINLAGKILAEKEQQEQTEGPQPLTQQQYQQQIVGKYLQQAGQQSEPTIGHGAQYLFLHQQLLALYELNRLSNGLGQIKDIDYDNLQAPYQPHLRNLNGLELPGRPDNLNLQAQKKKLIQHVHALEQRLMEAIDSGHVITPQGIFLSLYQPQGMNILGDLIQGSGRSVNPRYYGSLQAAARKLLGNAPEVQNIWDYTPSALELGQTAVHDPAFYQLYKKVMNLYQQYQQSLPPYQYNDLILPGVSIQSVDISQLVTLFTDFYVSLDAVTPQKPEAQPLQQVQGQIQAHLKRLDHKPFVYSVQIQSEQAVSGAIVRVFIGPKNDHQGKPVSISKNPQSFVQLDQFVQNLHPGQNVIVRNSQQAAGQSADWPSSQQIQQGVNNAIRSQEPFYVTEPHQIFSLPARLSLPKGQQQGFPLQLLVVISGPGPLNVPHGPVIPEQGLTYQSQQYQIINPEQYQHMKQGQTAQVSGGIQQNVEVLPEDLDTAQQQIPAVRNHYADVYTRYHTQYPNTQIQNPVGQGEEITYTIQGAKVFSAVPTVQLAALHGQEGISGQAVQQQMQQAQEIQQQIQSSNVGASVGQPQYPVPIYAQQPQGQAIKWPQQTLVSLPGQTEQELLQGAQQGLQGGKGVQQGIQGGFQGVQGVQQGSQIGQSGIQSGVSGLQGAQQSWGTGQTIQGVQVPYGVDHVQMSPSPIVLLQGAIPGTNTVASGQQHAGGFQGAMGQPATVQDPSVSEYFQNKPISQIIGGAISLDGKPLGFPLDRELTPGALSVPNIFVKDVLVFHEGQPTNEIAQQ